jgi:hypothetical protein
VPAFADDWTKAERGAIARFARRATVVTNSSPSSTGPTLVPDAREPRLVAGGMHAAQHSSLVVMEDPALPLLGWAMQLQALDLVSGVPTRDSRTTEQRRLLGRLVEQGYNGWQLEPGKSSARGTMARLAESGLSWAVFYGSVLAIDPHRANQRDLLRLAPPAWKRQAQTHGRTRSS